MMWILSVCIVPMDKDVRRKYSIFQNVDQAISSTERVRESRHIYKRCQASAGSFVTICRL